jgi:hypothetical protein
MKEGVKMIRKAELFYTFIRSSTSYLIGTLYYNNVTGNYKFTYSTLALINFNLHHVVEMLPFARHRSTVSDKLFPCFKRRLPDESRREGLSEFDALMYNEGRLPSDNFYFKEVFK